MFGMQLKIIIHAQKHNQEKRTQPIETKPEMTKMVEIGEKDIRTAIINMFHMIKKVEEILDTIKEMKYINRAQIKFMEMKNTIYEKKILDAIKSR